MFEKTAIFSAILVVAIFTTASIKFFQMTGLETESPVIVFREMFPPIDTTNN